MTSKQPEWTGKYVRILEKHQGYSGIVPGTIGYVATDRWLRADGTVCVDVYDSRHGEIVNLNFEPGQLERLDEGLLASGEPLSATRIRYEMLKSHHEKLKAEGRR